MYYESSSYSWPKSNSSKPYLNVSSSNSIAVNWYADQLVTANSYDLTNLNAVVNSIPSFLREDPNNTNYITFVHMIGQHFDNLWIYGKGVSDKYDADNRLNFGISKDLVAEVLKNFGVKLYTSNKSIEDLFSSFIGQAYQSGSEVINTYVTGSVTGSNTSIQPSSFDNYQREVYKRMYHNLPLLLKSKGTERGLRALINCFGIPSDILDIKVYGGRNTDERPFYGDYRYYTSSLDKVRLDNTGSIVPGSTLSQYTSILKRDYKYTDDIHPVEIGFSPTDNVDNYIISKSLSTGSLSSFNIDDYLGDPRNLYLSDYYNLGSSGNITGSLSLLTDQIMSGSDAYNVQDFVRLIKFFDNTIFKMVKDFIPARSTADTGIIIKPHVLQRNKAKSVQPEVEQPVYSGSIDTAFITGSDGKSFGGQDNYITSYTQNVQTPLGIGVSTYHSHAEARYDGEFEGTELVISTGSLNAANPFKYDNPVPENLYITLIQDFPINICVINSSYTPIVVTSHSTRDISLDFTSLGISGIVFTSASVDITSQATAFTFPSTNYQQHIVTASNASIDGCSGSITYNIQYCDIASTSTAPYSIISASGTPYDLTTWFSTGSNTNTAYTASWGSTVAGIPNSGSYVFTQPTGSVIVTMRDNIIAGCSQSISVEVIEAPGTCVFLESIRVLKNGGEGLSDSGTFSFRGCNNGGGGELEAYEWYAEYTPAIIPINICILSGSYSNFVNSATPQYSGNCYT